jgi:hypothetical protein
MTFGQFVPLVAENGPTPTSGSRHEETKDIRS